MSKTTPRYFPPALLFLLLIHGFSFWGCQLLAQDDYDPEVGGHSPWSEEDGVPFGDLEILDSQLDVSAQYARFTGEDMRDSYHGLPLVAAGYSCQMTRATRFFLSLGYGETTGNPYHDTPGFSAEDRLKVRYVPLLLGMKVDLAQSTRLHVYFSAALETAWMEETVPLMDDSGSVADLASSGFNTGYQVSFGPQFVLGQGGQAVGMEVGWGGSKGTVSSANHHHNLDLTGYRGRLFLALGL